MSGYDAGAPSGGDALATALPLLRDTLVRIADEARHVMIVTDATGRVLWRDTRRDPDSHPEHRWTPAACPVHEPDAGAVVGAVDVAGPVRTAVHPTTPALVLAAARLAEGLLAAQQAARDELLLARFLPLLDHLRDEPAALLTTSGRVLASNPEGWLPERVPVTPDTGVLLTPLPDGWLLRLRVAEPAGQ